MRLRSKTIAGLITFVVIIALLAPLFAVGGFVGSDSRLLTSRNRAALRLGRNTSARSGNCGDCTCFVDNPTFGLVFKPLCAILSDTNIMHISDRNVYISSKASGQIGRHLYFYGSRCDEPERSSHSTYAYRIKNKKAISMQ